VSVDFAPLSLEGRRLAHPRWATEPQPLAVPRFLHRGRWRPDSTTKAQHSLL